jgi:hypothetical protein
MNQLYQRMGDPNGNFRYDFQTDGFHSRVFELACYAYLEEGGFTVDRSFPAPDFIAARNGLNVAFEAATANPPSGRSTDISLGAMQQLSDEEVFEKSTREFPKRMASILRRKLKRRYEKLPHCAGRPLVLMVAPFFEPGAVFYTDDGLVDCLYGTAGTTFRPAEASAFFRQDEAGAISAVLYCNPFTVPRFFRLAGKLAPGLTAIRRGTCYLTDKAGEMRLADFEYRVGDTQVPAEAWSQGITLFLNPNAEIQLSADDLPCTSVFSEQDGCLSRRVRGFHPVVSFMLVHVPDGAADAP